MPHIVRRAATLRSDAGYADLLPRTNSCGDLRFKVAKWCTRIAEGLADGKLRSFCLGLGVLIAEAAQHADETCGTLELIESLLEIRLINMPS